MVGWRVRVGACAPSSYFQNLASPGKGTGHILFIFLAQQQDDLGAAFQTWMDAHRAVRPEVLPRPLLT